VWLRRTGMRVKRGFVFNGPRLYVPIALKTTAVFLPPVFPNILNTHACRRMGVKGAEGVCSKSKLPITHRHHHYHH